VNIASIPANSSNVNPSNLQHIAKQCEITWDQEQVSYFHNLTAKVQPLEIIDQPSFFIEPSIFSAMSTTIPTAQWVIDSSKNFVVFCPESESFEEMNWVWSSWEKQIVYNYPQITIEKGYTKAIEKISTFHNLSLNWDSFHSKQIDSNCISRASKILIDLSKWQAPHDIPSPFVAPRPDGSIQIEWEQGSRYLELGIVPDSSTIEFVAMDETHEGSPIEFEGIIELEASIKELLQWFINGEAEEVKQLFAKIK
jgi:hypothetical protein